MSEVRWAVPQPQRPPQPRSRLITPPRPERGTQIWRGQFLETSVPSGADNLGTQVPLPGVAHSKGNWTTLIASTDFDAYWVTVLIHQSNSPGNDSSVLLDVGVGAADTEAVILPNLSAGYVANFAGKEYNFPYFVPAGSRIAARVQGTQTTGGPRVGIYLYGNPPEGVVPWYAHEVNAVGTVLASSRGTLVTATTGGEGSWTTLGTAPKEASLLAVGAQNGSDTGLTVANFALDIGTGGTPTALISNLAIRTLVNELGGPYPAFIPIFQDIPEGETISARMQTHVATDLTLDVQAYLMT